MDYHGRIMNIADGRDGFADMDVVRAYKSGHRDARHAAAEIANEADAEIARLRDALTHIAEYWNRSENDTAMNDALFHMIETAEGALAQAAEVPNETV